MSTIDTVVISICFVSLLIEHLAQIRRAVSDGKAQLYRKDRSRYGKQVIILALPAAYLIGLDVYAEFVAHWHNSGLLGLTIAPLGWYLGYCLNQALKLDAFSGNGYDWRIG